MSTQASDLRVRMLARLREAARRLGPPPAPPSGVAEFDWTRPHHFTAAEAARLGRLADRAAEAATDALVHLLPPEGRVAADPPRETYHRDVHDPARPLYYVPLRDAEGRPVGALAFPGTLAAGWVERLLGGSPDLRSDPHGLSPLEENLLLDIASWIAKAIAEVCGGAGTERLVHEAALLAWDEALPAEASEELCRFDFREIPPEPLEDPEGEPPAEASQEPAPENPEQVVPSAEDERSKAADEASAPGPGGEAAPGEAEPTEGLAPEPFSLLLLARFLEPAALDNPLARRQADDPQATAERIRRWIEAAPVLVRAQLGKTSLTLSDLLALEPGDVVVLDRMVGETVDLTVDGRIVLRAQPVQCQGRYAVQIHDLRRYPRLELAV